MNDVFGSSAAGFVIFLLIILVIVLLVAVTNVNMKMNRLQRRYNLFMKGSDGQSVEKAMSSRLRELGKLRSRQEKSREDLMDLQHQYNSMLCKYGIVKYDAFEDVGGKMSFALAMLDQNNTGFVLNAIHSRDNCYLYLKDVVKGTSYIMLSDEEVEALRRASRFGEADMAAAATRRKKRDEERARKEAEETAKAERRQAAQAAQRKRRVETPEEAELRMMEEIIANAETKAPDTAADTGEGPEAPKQTDAPRRVRQAAEQDADVKPAVQAGGLSIDALPIRQAAGTDTVVRSVSEMAAKAEAAARSSAEPVTQISDEIPAPPPVRRKSASARRIDDGMPELTE